MEVLREQTCDGPQLRQRSCFSKDPRSSEGPAHNIRLGNPGLDLVGSDHAKICTEPSVACATAISPGTPQLPPSSQGGESTGLEIALASTPPISKKLPAVAAAPIRKKFASSALPGIVRQTSRTITTTLSGLRQ